MKYLILVGMIVLGFHGKRHNISHVYLNYFSYKTNKDIRAKKLSDWMHDNGIGA